MLIIEDDFRGLDKPRHLHEFNAKLDALTSRAINKGFDLTARETMTQASRYVGAPLGAPARRNKNVAFAQRSSRTRLEATLVLVNQVQLSVHRLRHQLNSDGTLTFTSRRRRHSLDGVFVGKRNYLFRRDKRGDYKDAGGARYKLVTIAITLPAGTLRYLYRRFEHEFNRALDGGLQRLLRAPRAPKAL